MTANTINTDALFFTSLVTPEAIEHVNNALMKRIVEVAAAITSNPRARVWFLGGGASLAAMHGGAYLLERFTGVPVSVATGWQFLSRQPHAVDEHAHIFLTSYSGETPEIIEAQRFAASRGATTIAITNTAETPLARDARAALDFQSKAVFTAPLAIVYALAAHIMRGRDENAQTGATILEELRALPQLMALQAERTRDLARRLAAEAADIDVFYVIGSGPNYGLAYKLALSVIIENLWKDAAPVDAGEFYHGPIEIIPGEGAADDRRAFLHLVGTDASAIRSTTRTHCFGLRDEAANLQPPVLEEVVREALRTAVRVAGHQARGLARLPRPLEQVEGRLGVPVQRANPALALRFEQAADHLRGCEAPVFRDACRHFAGSDFLPRRAATAAGRSRRAAAARFASTICS